MPILKCVGKEDGNYILREVHEGVCCNHIEARCGPYPIHGPARLAFK